MRDLDRWQERVALVTGASSGIGVAVARALWDIGMKVAVCARRVDRLEGLCAEAPEGKALPIKCDLRDEGQIHKMFQRIREAWHGVDVLVNNAGLGHSTSIVQGYTDHWKETFDVNVIALMVCTREAIRDIRDRGDRGHVINISSLSGHRVPKGAAVYAASKFAVRAITEGVRQELRDLDSGIRVTAISPGNVTTEFHEKYFGSREDADAERTFKYLEPEDVAEAVLYILSQPPRVQIHDILMRPVTQPA